jgi:small-conductance mechanosensitive channel
MGNFWSHIVLGNTLRDWGIACGIILCLIIVLRITQVFGVRRFKKLATRTKNSFDDFVVLQVHKSIMPCLYVFSVYLGLQYLKFSERITDALKTGILIVVAFFVIKVISGIITYLFEPRVGDTNYVQNHKALRGITLIIKILVWAGGILFIIDNLGYDITAIIAGLGIGGIAIALASQTVLADLFNYFAIFFDKPFEVGDFLVVDDKKGTVEYIGIRTTRVRSLSGEQLVFSNTDLTNSRVHNYKRMIERRVVLTFGVVYETPADKLKKIPGWTKTLIDGIDETRFDRAHFTSFGDSSLNFEVVYFILNADYNSYMDKQQQINLRVMEQFHHEGIQFAFPSRTIYMNLKNTEHLFRPPARVN